MNEKMRLCRLASIVLISAFFLSCAASQHAGVAKVNQPAPTDTSELAWYAYYVDQFDAYGTNVLPPKDQFPEAARQAYQHAQTEAYKKVNEESSTSDWVVYVGVAAGSAVVILLLTGWLSP